MQIHIVYENHLADNLAKLIVAQCHIVLSGLKIEHHGGDANIHSALCWAK